MDRSHDKLNGYKARIEMTATRWLILFALMMRRRPSCDYQLWTGGPIVCYLTQTTKWFMRDNNPHAYGRNGRSVFLEAIQRGMWQKRPEATEKKFSLCLPWFRFSNKQQPISDLIIRELSRKVFDNQVTDWRSNQTSIQRRETWAIQPPVKNKALWFVVTVAV